MSEEMEDAVDQEVRHLEGKRTTRGPGLRPRGLDRDVDLAQEYRPRRVGELPRVGEGKGEHVGRVVVLEEVPVQGPDPLVVDEDQGDGGARKAQRAERGAEDALKSGRS